MRKEHKKICRGCAERAVPPPLDAAPGKEGERKEKKGREKKRPIGLRSVAGGGTQTQSGREKGKA